MSGGAARRIWKDATAEAVEGGFGVHLDGRPVKTPSKASLVVPTLDLAEMIAAEWRAQQETVDPNSMPATRMANSAIDKVAIQRAGIVDHLAAYGETDLLCYRAEGPQGLVDRQAAAWDPLLDWAADTFGARLMPVEGVIPAPQDPQAIAALAHPMETQNDFELAAFHDLVGLSGSIVIAYAATSRFESPEKLWELSRLDEVWQIEQWGDDDIAQEVNDLRKKAFLEAFTFFHAASIS